MPTSQSLFDTLAGGFGHGVDRPGLESFVANSQSINGLRTAQTEEALNNAQMQREEMAARAKLEDTLAGTLGPDGTPMFSPSQAHMAAQSFIAAHGGKVADGIDAYIQMQKAHNTDVLSNPNNLGTPAATAAVAGLKGALPETQEVKPNYVVPPGLPAPVVHQTPDEAAKAALTTMQAQHPELFHTPGAGALDPQTAAEVAEFIRQNPNLAGNIRSLVSSGGAQVVHAFMHPESMMPGTSPAQAGSPAPPLGSTAPGAKPPKPAKVTGVTPPEPGAPPAPAAPSTQPSAVAPANGVLPAPGVSLHEQGLIRSDFASGLGAKQSSALNTMVQHASLFDQIADQLGNGNFTPTNAIAQTWAKMFGSPIPSNLKIAAGFLGREAVRATVNAGAGTGEERELAVSDSSSPDALHGAASTLRSLAGGQLRSLDRRARRGGVDITQLLDPETIQAYGMGHTPTPAPSGNGVKVANDDDYNALPSGAHFTGPDGVLRVKP